MSRLAFAFVSVLVVAGWSVPAAAHIEMTYPPMRYTQEFIKDGPCGMIGNPPGVNEPTVLQAGEMITITLDEFVNHDGHFRISFSEDGTDQFVNPAAFDDFYNDPSVLLDDIADDQDGGTHEIDFVVPNVNCNPCTLQALQVMMDGGGFSEGSLYYNCADIVIEGAVEGTTSGTDTMGTASVTVTTTDSVTDTNGDDTSSEGGADGTTTAAADDIGDDAPAETGDDGSTGNSVTAGSESTTDANQDEDEGGCSCSEGQRSNALWALPLFVIALARRRR